MADPRDTSVVHYRFRGNDVDGVGMTLEEAADSLKDSWDDKLRYLSKKDPGSMKVIVTIGGVRHTIEIVDWAVLDEIVYRANTSGLVDVFAREMGMSREDTEAMLLQTDMVEMRVDTLRKPEDTTAWRIEPEYEPSQILPDAALTWAKKLSEEADLGVGRQRGRRRTVESRRWMSLAIELGRKRGLSDTEIAKRTGFARSTVRDARLRAERQEEVVRRLPARRPGERLGVDAQKVILERLAKAGDNAAAVARELGIPPRTVREVRARAREQAMGQGVAGYEQIVPETRLRRSYTEQDRAKLLDRVRTERITATEAARKLGIPSRTARDWVRAERMKILR